MKKVLFIFLGMGMVFLPLYFFLSGDEKTAPLVKSQVNIKHDKYKQAMINSAAATYYAETGKKPSSLQELVDSGFLEQKHIADHNGNPMQFDSTKLDDPKPFDSSNSETVSLSKECGSCGHQVSSSSKVGDTCPHCGVRWGYESTRHAP